MMFANFFKRISFHPTLFIFFAIAFFTGTFVQLLIVFTIVLIHELGHYVAASIVHWRVEKMVLWIFGGILYTDEHFNRPLREEVFVTMFGPLQHIFLYGVIYALSFIPHVPPTLLEQALFFNTVILLFNLLPIYPLDGGKFLLYLFAYMFPFSFAYRFMLYVTFGVLVIFCLIMYITFPFTLSIYLVCLFLFIENFFAWKNRTYAQMRFLLGRMNRFTESFVTHFIFVRQEERLYDVLKKWKRYRQNVVIIEDSLKQLTEKQLLHLFKKTPNIRKEIGMLMNDTP